MKDILIGMGIGFVVGAIACRTNKCVADTVEKTLEKSKEVIGDIKDEVKTQTNKSKKEIED